MPIQHARRVNLRAVLTQLQREGFADYEDQARHIGNVTGQRLADMDQGAEIDAAFAEQVEWALNRRRGWMDELHGDDPLEA